MRNKLLRLYRACLSEWALVETELLKQFKGNHIPNQVVRLSQLSIQDSSL
jgi:hypothetical protein